VRVEARIFSGVALFLFLAALVYGVWSREPAGTTAIALSGGLCGLCGSYFAFVARRIEPRPEDRPDADISEGAGDLGFFSPGSYWPVATAAAAALTGLGVVFGAVWLVVVGLGAVLLAVSGLLFEYYVGQA